MGGPRDKSQKLAYQRAYREANPEKFKKYRKQKYLKNTSNPAARARAKEHYHTHKKKLKREVIDHYGGRCACCGEPRLAFLTIDHKQGSGTKHRREINNGKMGGGLRTYIWLRQNNYPEGFQVLCWNCNCGRSVNGGVCPHKTEVQTYEGGDGI